MPSKKSQRKKRLANVNIKYKKQSASDILKDSSKTISKRAKKKCRYYEKHLSPKNNNTNLSATCSKALNSNLDVSLSNANNIIRIDSFDEITKTKSLKMKNTSKDILEISDNKPIARQIFSNSELNSIELMIMETNCVATQENFIVVESSPSRASLAASSNHETTQKNLAAPEATPSTSNVKNANENSFNLDKDKSENNSHELEENLSHNSGVSVLDLEEIKVNTPNTSKSVKTIKSLETPKNSANRNLSFEEYMFQPMTEQMKVFYNNSWGGETFSVSKIQKTMPKNQQKWEILPEDKDFRHSWYADRFIRKCGKCRRNGHISIDCPEPNKPPVCYMCGDTGHFDSRCPNAKCLNCGDKRNVFRKTCQKCKDFNCDRCFAKGHTSTGCPDLWRQYHQTTDLNEELPSHFSTVMKPYYTLHCCNCTERGHESSSCTKLRWSAHFFNPIYVTKYENSTTKHQSGKVNDDVILSTSAVQFMSNVNESSIDNNTGRKSNNTSFEKNKKKETKQNIVNTCGDFLIQDVRKDIIFCYKGNQFKQALVTQQNVLRDILRNVITQAELKLSIVTCEFQKFLKCLVETFKAEITLRRCNDNIYLDVSCDVAVKLIKCICIQYFERNNTEKKELFYDCSTTKEEIKKLFDMIKQSLAESTEDPLSLYDKINSGTLTGEELLKCNKQLLIALYKFGSIDIYMGRESFINVQLYLTSGQNKNHLISYFGLIFLYNSIFVPQSIKNLPMLIACYKNCRNQKSRIQELRQKNAEESQILKKKLLLIKSAINFELRKCEKQHISNNSAVPNKTISKNQQQTLQREHKLDEDSSVLQKFGKQHNSNDSAVPNITVSKNQQQTLNRERKLDEDSPVLQKYEKQHNLDNSAVPDNTVSKNQQQTLQRECRLNEDSPVLPKYKNQHNSNNSAVPNKIVSKNQQKTRKRKRKLDQDSPGLKKFEKQHNSNKSAVPNKIVSTNQQQALDSKRKLDKDSPVLQKFEKQHNLNNSAVPDETVSKNKKQTLNKKRKLDEDSPPSICESLKFRRLDTNRDFVEELADFKRMMDNRYHQHQQPLLPAENSDQSNNFAPFQQNCEAWDDYCTPGYMYPRVYSTFPQHSFLFMQQPVMYPLPIPMPHPIFFPNYQR